MMELLVRLAEDAQAQAALVGVVVAGLIAAYKAVRQGETPEEVASARRFLAAVLGSAVAVAASLAAQGELGWTQWLTGFVLAALSSQAAYGTGKGLARSVRAMFIPPQVEEGR
jgi:hypothetical protein